MSLNGIFSGHSVEQVVSDKKVPGLHSVQVVEYESKHVLQTAAQLSHNE